MSRAGTGTHDAVTWQPRWRRGCQRRVPWQCLAVATAMVAQVRARAWLLHKRPGDRSSAQVQKKKVQKKKRKKGKKEREREREREREKKTYLLLTGVQGHTCLWIPLSSRVFQGKGEDGRGWMGGTRENGFQVRIRTCVTHFHTCHNLGLRPDSARMDFFWLSQA